MSFCRSCLCVGFNHCQPVSFKAFKHYHDDYHHVQLRATLYKSSTVAVRGIKRGGQAKVKTNSAQ
jgi:hypothetical protein